MNPLNIVFMGTPETAVPALLSLHRNGHRISAVYCQPPKPAGRGHALQKSPVHIEAEKLGIQIRTPKTLKNKNEQKFLEELKPDAIVVAAYGLLLPPEVLRIPKLGCMNIHFSLLPRWRGASPVQHAILAGDEETGVCIMQMDEGLDTGDILLCEKVPIAPNDTSASLLPLLAEKGAELIIKALEGKSKGIITPKPQPHEGATFAPRLSRADGKIDWRKSAAEIERQVRAFIPWPGSFFELNGETVKVLEAKIEPDKSGKPGELLDDSFTVACGEQALRLIKVQRAGKKETDGTSFLRGARLPKGFVLP